MLHQHAIRLSGFHVIAPFWCLGHFGNKAIKRHITYPRTGYAAYRNMKGLSWVKVAVVSAIAAAIAAGIIAFALRHSTITPLRLAIVVGVSAAYCLFGLLVARTQPWKWLVYGLFAVGMAAILLKSGDTGRTALLLAGCTYVASGAVTFWLYLRRTHPAGRTAFEEYRNKMKAVL